MSAGREYAKTIFVHYFNLIYKGQTGRNLESDSVCEIEGAVDAIYEDAVRELERKWNCAA